MFLALFFASFCAIPSSFAAAPLFFPLIDSAISSVEQSKLESDFKRVQEIKYNSEALGPAYKKIFKSEDALGLVNYLKLRISYILPRELDFRSRIYFKNPNQVTLPRGFLQHHSIPTSPGRNVVARNQSTPLWFLAEGARQDKLEVVFKTKDGFKPLDSSRIGIIQLGPEYFGNKQHTAIDRISFLIHEARHSDCSHGIKRSYINDLYNKPEMGFRFHQGPFAKCGNYHQECPILHSLSGLAACDNSPWGGYGIQAIFLAKIYRSCQNCSEQEKQHALVSFNDFSERLVVRSGDWDDNKNKEILKDWLLGKYGWPDLSSKGVLEDLR